MATTAPCPQCGAPFAPWNAKGGRRNFCSGECRAAFHARAKLEGALIVQLAKAWRAQRGSGEIAKAAFKELCSALDMLNARDREMGRPAVTDHVGRLLGSGFRVIDRTRSNA